MNRRIILALLLAPSLILPAVMFVARGGFLVDGTAAGELPVSWQMYSVVEGEPVYLADGEPVTVESRHHYGTVLLDRFCVDTGADVVERVGWYDERRVEC